MSLFPDRDRTALLVIDVQNDVVAHAWQPGEVVGRIASLVARARDEGVDVIWVQHSSPEMPIDSAGWQLVPELVPGDEPIVHKRFGDSFEETDLSDLLAERRVGRLVVCGAQSDACVISTLYGALVRGYDVTLASDAHTTDDRAAYGGGTAAQTVTEISLIWSFRTAPGRVADAAPAAEVRF